MKISLTLSVFILLSTLFSGPVLAKPQLVPENPALHFGTIGEGEKVEHVFTFTNQGDETLIIERVRTTCGCTGTLLSQKEIPPGQTGEIKTTFNSNGMRGPVVKWVYVYSNDPVTPKTGLQISGVVQPEIEIQPTRLRLTGMTPGEKRQAQITLTNNGKRTIFLSGLMTAPEALSANLSQTRLDPGASVHLKLSLELPPGKNHQNGYITLSTSSPRTPKLRIPVFGVGASPAS